MNGISELFVVNYGKELPKMIRVTFTGVSTIQKITTNMKMLSEVSRMAVNSLIKDVTVQERPLGQAHRRLKLHSCHTKKITIRKHLISSFFLSHSTKQFKSCTLSQGH